VILLIIVVDLTVIKSSHIIFLASLELLHRLVKFLVLHRLLQCKHVPHISFLISGFNQVNVSGLHEGLETISLRLIRNASFFTSFKRSCRLFFGH
jgi:hypothetical protein